MVTIPPRVQRVATAWRTNCVLTADNEGGTSLGQAEVVLLSDYLHRLNP
jgi:hypothetical protein